MTYPNPHQQQVIDHLHGPLLVLAPAGTGKTRVMADRLAAILSQGMPPERTLGVTFTNRAAEHMRTAVRESCGDTGNAEPQLGARQGAAKHCRIQTFHSLCAWMLRTEARDLGLHPDFVIYDEDDSIDLMGECLGPSSRAASSTYHELADLKSSCPDDRLTLSVIPGLSRQLYEKSAIDRYHQSLAERNALDYADLVYRTRAMLALLPEKRAKWSARFQWIQMDEVQDTHVSEYENDPFHSLLHALAHSTVVVFDVETTGLSPAEEVPRGTERPRCTQFKLPQPFSCFLVLLPSRLRQIPSIDKTKKFFAAPSFLSN